MTSDGFTLMEAALDVARVAGEVALRAFRRPLAVEAKADGSPVTAADREAEAAAREWLSHRFPADGILGEESGALRVHAGRRWIIDPIDGTRSFIRGVPLWGTVVAVVERTGTGVDRVMAGAAWFPALQEAVVAAPGCGTWWNGSRCRVSEIADLANATVLTTDAHFPVHPERQPLWLALSGKAAASRTWGDCYGYLLVATGRAEVMVDDRVWPWDVAAFKPIIEEAGGVLTDWRGRHTPFGGDAISTNAALAEDVRRRLGVHARADGPAGSDRGVTPHRFGTSAH